MVVPDSSVPFGDASPKKHRIDSAETAITFGLHSDDGHGYEYCR
jgi:hypothetical protein